MLELCLFDIPEGIVLRSDVLEDIAALVARAAPSEESDPSGIVNVAFVPDDRMRELNKLYRDKDSTTDVLSFRYAELLDDPESTVGDMILSFSRVSDQADEYGLSREEETYKLVTHGLLHLLGYDHETDEEYAAMRAHEERVEASLTEKYAIHF